MKVWLVRYGEIGLKGKNRPFFEKILIRNMKDCLKRNNIPFKISKVKGRILVESEKDCSVLKNVFGIVSISPSIKTKKPKEEAFKLYKKGKTFRISSKVVEKIKGESASKLNEEIGEYIFNKGGKVKLKNPDIDIGVELIKGNYHVFSERIEGPGGLPVGTEGKVGVLVESEKSLIVAYLLMKRGVVPYFIGEIDLEELNKYEYGIRFKKVEKLPEKGEVIAVEDSFDSIKEYKDYVVLRPLLGIENLRGIL